MEKLKKGDGGIQLISGRIFRPLWPTPESFTVNDIAHGLTAQKRFAGHTIIPYTVAQHCVIMCRYFRKIGLKEHAKWALMHESEEGLGLGDMPSPIKYLKEMTPYRVIAKNVQYASYRKVGLIGEPPPEVKELDDQMKAAEAKVLCPIIPEWAKVIDTDHLAIKPYKNPLDGKKYFLREFSIVFPDLDIHE